MRCSPDGLVRHPKPWQLAGTARFLCLHEIAALPDYDTIEASCWRWCWISGRGISEAIVLGCAGMLDLAADLSACHGLPVLDGVACAIKLVETLVGLGGYAPPLPRLMAAGSQATGLTNRHCFNLFESL
jgi:hypothetical protein